MKSKEKMSFDDLMKKQFAKKHRINLEVFSKLNVKEDFILRMNSGETLYIPLEEIEEIARPACLSCKNFANYYADISAGGLGSPDGYTTVLIRTIQRRTIYTNALHQSYIESKDEKNFQGNEAEKAKMLALIEIFEERKRNMGKVQKWQNLPIF